MVYIDLNMVRAGVASHPSQWSFCGYYETQEPRRKNVLINYARFRQLPGYNTYDRLKACHNKWVESLLSNGKKWQKIIGLFHEKDIQIKNVSSQG